jgi:hypothetical protein
MLAAARAEINTGVDSQARGAELKAFIANLEKTMATKAAEPAKPDPVVQAALTEVSTASAQTATALNTEIPALKTEMASQLTTLQSSITSQTSVLGGKLDTMSFSMAMSAAAMQTAANRPMFPMTATPKYNGSGRSMSLGSAIATENRHKPSGSSLVIANSSESVIPANKGYSPYGGGGGMNVTNNFTINGGGMDPQALAEQVAAVVMNSVEEASYSEIYTS